MKVLFVVSEDWYFVSHRLEMAKYLMQRGWEVALACRVRAHREVIEQAGIRLMEVPFHRESVSLLDFLRESYSLRTVILDYRPDCVQCVAIRSILTGWIATMLVPRIRVFYAMTGFGSLFSAKLKTLRLRLIRIMVELAFCVIFRRRRSRVIIQNQDDYKMFLDRGWTSPARAILIRGAGIDSSHHPKPETDTHEPRVLFVGRLLGDKGIRELVQAMEIINRERICARLRIVGDIDACNHNAVSEEEVEQWQRYPWLEYMGRRKDVLKMMDESHLVVLPSYREGLPRVLLEAGVAQRAAITCDTQGCREVVIHGENGMLVPVKSVEPLAEAIQKLLDDPASRHEMAWMNRQRVVDNFSNRTIFELMHEALEQAIHDEH